MDLLDIQLETITADELLAIQRMMGAQPGGIMKMVMSDAMKSFTLKVFADPTKK